MKQSKKGNKAKYTIMRDSDCYFLTYKFKDF
jgi:hypothetical protein